MYNPKMLKNRTPYSVYYLAFAQQSTNNEQNAWAADNLAPLDMPFLSIIA